jgi:hypothetical protein
MCNSHTLIVLEMFLPVSYKWGQRGGNSMFPCLKPVQHHTLNIAQVLFYNFLICSEVCFLEHKIAVFLVQIKLGFNFSKKLEPNLILSYQISKN